MLRGISQFSEISLLLDAIFAACFLFKMSTDVSQKQSVPENRIWQEDSSSLLLLNGRNHHLNMPNNILRFSERTYVLFSPKMGRIDQVPMPTQSGRDMTQAPTPALSVRAVVN